MYFHLPAIIMSLTPFPHSLDFRWHTHFSFNVIQFNIRIVVTPPPKRKLQDLELRVFHIILNEYYFTFSISINSKRKLFI